MHKVKFSFSNPRNLTHNPQKRVLPLPKHDLKLKLHEKPRSHQHVHQIIKRIYGSIISLRYITHRHYTPLTSNRRRLNICIFAYTHSKYISATTNNNTKNKTIKKRKSPDSDRSPLRLTLKSGITTSIPDFLKSNPAQSSIRGGAGARDSLLLQPLFLTDTYTRQRLA